MRTLLLALIPFTACLAQTGSGDITPKGRVDMGSAASTALHKKGSLASRPATCAIGDTYFVTDATPGRNVYGCTATNQWTIQGASSPVDCSQKFTISHSQVTAAATSQNVTLFVVPADTMIWGLRIKEQTQFAGGSATSLTVSVGVSGDETHYSPPWPLKQVVSNTRLYPDGGFAEYSTAAHTAVAQFVSTGANLNTFTSGSVVINVCTVSLP